MHIIIDTIYKTHFLARTGKTLHIIEKRERSKNININYSNEYKKMDHFMKLVGKKYL